MIQELSPSPVLPPPLAEVAAAHSLAGSDRLLDDTKGARAWTRVEAALLTHFYEPDIEAARAFYAALAAHDLPGQLVWPMLIAPPGCGKTELINPLHGLKDVHLIDSLTPNTFISGKTAEPNKPKGKDGLLERVGNSAIIIFPDFSTVLEGNRERRGDVFAQLRRLYDGRLRREFGVEHIDSVTEWAGRLTVSAAVTPAVDGFISVFGQLGARFILIRWKRIGGIDAALTAMHQDQTAKDADMRTAVHALFDTMKDAPVPRMPGEVERSIAAIAELIAMGRTPVKRDRKGDVEYLPEAEGATRLAQQFCQLAKGSARLVGRALVNRDDLALVHRVAFDTLPPQRAVVLRAVVNGKSADDVDLPRTTRTRAISDLVEIGLLVEDDHHQFTEGVRELVKAGNLLTM